MTIQTPSISKSARVILFLLRIALGWMFLYVGITKLVDPAWTAAGYIGSAKTLTGFFAWLALPAHIGWVNFLNEWGAILIGTSLILGIGVRLASLFGALMMVLYYLPILQFPYPDPHSFIVDQHVIYALVFLFFAAVRAGRFYGLETWCANLPLCKKFPRLHAWWG